jgi:ribonucleoside-diphosphate reductase alpha chain
VTSNPEIPFAKSVMDYIFRWLELKFGERETGRIDGEGEPEPSRPPAENRSSLLDVMSEAEERFTSAAAGSGTGARIRMAETERQVFRTQSDSPPCPECGSVMVRNGTCYKCLNCAATSGCS